MRYLLKNRRVRFQFRAIKGCPYDRGGIHYRQQKGSRLMIINEWLSGNTRFCQVKERWSWYCKRKEMGRGKKSQTLSSSRRRNGLSFSRWLSFWSYIKKRMVQSSMISLCSVWIDGRSPCWLRKDGFFTGSTNPLPPQNMLIISHIFQLCIPAINEHAGLSIGTDHPLITWIFWIWYRWAIQSTVALLF